MGIAESRPGQPRFSRQQFRNYAIVFIYAIHRDLCDSSRDKQAQHDTERGGTEGDKRNVIADVSAVQLA